MTETVETLFDTGIERYKAGESPEALIPVFKEVCERAPKSSASWTCLAWLYLLEDKASSALKAAQKAVKLNPQDPQARVNLAVAMLDSGKTGVREHIEVATQVMMAVPELKQEVQESIQDGFSRRPDWPSMSRVHNWLFGA
ncbi:MAG TPA: hypothetical protein V6D06_19590 [Trichocoleus sp.]